MQAFPALSNLISILLCIATPLFWEDSNSLVHEILSHTGLDQGCPLSLLLFLFGMRRVLARTRKLLQKQNPAAELALKAYVDDVYAACRVDHIRSVMSCFFRG